MVDEACRCGHSRVQHSDRDNHLEIVPLGMTEADGGDDLDIPHVVRGEGHCTVVGCRCHEFIFDE